jgi:4-hydroxy-tetrahydrodipicolinate reductase
MGQSILRAAGAEPRWRLIGALASAQSRQLGEDAAGAGAPSGVKITADAAAALIDSKGRKAAVALDFSSAEAIPAHAEACAAAGVPLLVGTTALQPAGLAALEEASALPRARCLKATMWRFTRRITA